MAALDNAADDDAYALAAQLLGLAFIARRTMTDVGGAEFVAAILDDAAASLRRLADAGPGIAPAAGDFASASHIISSLRRNAIL